VGWASCPPYKLGGQDAMPVNLSQNPSKISFRWSKQEMQWARLVTLNWEAEPQVMHSQPEAGNEASRGFVHSVILTPDD